MDQNKEGPSEAKYISNINESVENVDGTIRVIDTDKNTEANINVTAELENKIDAAEKGKREETDAETIKKQEDVSTLDEPDHPGEAQVQVPIQPRRVAKRGRSLIPRQTEAKEAPQNFVDVPDYGYVGIDGSYQVPF